MSTGMAANGNALTRQGTPSMSRWAELLFYASKADAYEESAYLVGKRVGQAAQVVEARRARSLGGGPRVMDLHTLGRMGIGCVEGVVNTAGTRVDGGPEELGEGPQQAMEAPTLSQPGRGGRGRCGQCSGQDGLAAAAGTAEPPLGSPALVPDDPHPRPLPPRRAARPRSRHG